MAKISRGAFLLSGDGPARVSAGWAPQSVRAIRWMHSACRELPALPCVLSPRDRLNHIRRGEFAINRLAAVLPRGLLANGSGRLRLRARGLKTKDRFTFLH